MARRLLMVAYHFPPLAGSSGIQRTLRFVQHLPKFGWEALVLSAHPRAYERTSDDLDGELPPALTVRRAFALDAARHLSLAGRYPAAWGRPDRWWSWRYAAVREGMRLIRAHQPQALWSTYPIATAHEIGAELQRRSGLPWIADFRDPMAQEGYPSDPLTWLAYQRIERRVAAQARLSVFTTPTALDTYRTRYPQAAARMCLVENGYDEPSFAQCEARLNGQLRDALVPGALTLLHSGIVYPQDRDPKPMFQAVHRLWRAGHVGPERLRLRFRAAVHDDFVRRMAEEAGVAAFLDLAPPAPYGQALEEMLRADGLLLLQAGTCNEQVPAKLYEYLRAGRPIVGLCTPAGDTGRALQQSGVRHAAALERPDDIANLLLQWLQGGADGLRPRAHAVADASRESRTRQLAAALDACV